MHGQTQFCARQYSYRYSILYGTRTLPTSEATSDLHPIEPRRRYYLIYTALLYLASLDPNSISPFNVASGTRTCCGVGENQRFYHGATVFLFGQLGH